MEKTPFSVYDFFAYLSSGSVIVVTADYIWNTRLLTQEKIGPVYGVALIILAYVLGHIVAHFSSWILEFGLAKRLLRSPSESLFGVKPRWTFLRWIFRAYHRELSKTTQDRINQQKAARHVAATGEGLFQHAYPLVTAIDRYQTRLDDFRNQYGFARNMSFSFLVSAAAIGIAHLYGPNPVRLRWALLAALAGISLFFRYLKFFWQYSYELFLRYSELPDAGAKLASGNG